VRQREEVQALPRGIDGRLSSSVGVALALTDPVREFIRAFNERDLDAFVAVLDPEVEIHSSRGLRKGLEAARQWATRKPGGVQQSIELEQLYEEGLEGGGGRAVALVVRRWRWEESGEPAGEEEMAWAFELRGRRVLSWRPYEDRAKALAELGFTHG
jgi:limonene-1,2-epoxide hydrolase